MIISTKCFRGIEVRVGQVNGAELSYIGRCFWCSWPRHDQAICSAAFCPINAPGGALRICPTEAVCPNARQLHEFRDRLTPMILRRINEQLLGRLLAGWPKDQWGIGLIDATDLPAATNEYKKKPQRILCT
jgi:hypothetical protein